MKWSMILGLLLLALAVHQRAQAQTATVTWGTTHQTIEGFGASNFGGANLTSAQNTFFWNTLGYSVLRTGVSMDGSCSTVGSACANSTPAFSNGSYFVPELPDIEAASAAGVRIVATIWCAPAIYNTGGTECAYGSAAPVPASGSYSAYATYISNWLTSLANNGVSIYAISLFNEPGSSGYNAYFTGFLPVLGATLATNGFGSVKLIAPETNKYQTGTSMDSIASVILDSSSAASYLSACATHDYDGSPGLPPTPTADADCANADKELWQTETEGSNLSGNAFDPSMTNGLAWAKSIHYWLSGANANMWLYWWLVNWNQPCGVPGNHTGEDNEGLVNLCSNETAISAYTIGNWAKFVRPGWVRIDATTNPQTGVYVTAFKNAGTSFAIVAVNTASGTTSQEFVMNGFPTVTSVTPWITSSTDRLSAQSSVVVDSNSFSFSLPAESVTTFVGTTSGSSTGSPVAPPSRLSVSVK